MKVAIRSQIVKDVSKCKTKIAIASADLRSFKNKDSQSFKNMTQNLSVQYKADMSYQ